MEADPFILRRFLTGALSWTITWYRPEGDMTIEDLADHVLMVLKIPLPGGLT